MARTTSVEGPPVRRLAAAVGAAALAWVGVVGTDIPASVVTTTSVHVPSTPVVLTAAGTPVTTVVAEAGASSPVHVGRTA